jgi:hypothetical protein
MRAPLGFLITTLALGLSACGGEQRPVASAASASNDPPAGAAVATGSPMPGDCVDPLADGDKHDPARPFDKHVQLDVRNEDLDGDGSIDTFVKPAWACGDACKRSVYVMRGTCGHYVGTFPSVDRYEALDQKTNGLRDLSTRPRQHEDDGEMHCYQVVYKFDGKAYQKARQRECECKDEGAKCTAWNE